MDFGPEAAYERRMIFLGPGQRLPTAAIVDFVAVSDEAGLRRGVRARLSDGTEWSRLMDAGWEMDRMREPWLLVPHGPMRLVIGDEGEVDAIVFRSDSEVRIEPGGLLGQRRADAGTQLVLRQGRLAFGGDLVQGILLDARLGRALSTPPERDRADDQEVRSADDGATPTVMPGAEALLLGEAGFYLVFGRSAEDQLAWLKYTHEDELLAGARLTAVGWELDPEGFRVPNAWQIIGNDYLAGELVAEVVDGVDVSATGEAEGLSYAIVSGWVEDRGVHRDVYGVVRHVR